MSDSEWLKRELEDAKREVDSLPAWRKTNEPLPGETYDTWRSESATREAEKKD